MGMDSCLSVYSDASWARFTEKFEGLPYTKTKAMRPLFANAAKCEPDAQGRDRCFRRSSEPTRHLEKDVVVIGVLEPRRDLERGKVGRDRGRGISTPRIWPP